MFSLIGIPFCASFSSAITNVCIGAATLAFFVKKAFTKDLQRTFRQPIVLPFLLLILFSLISFVNTVSLSASFQGVGKLVRYLVLVLIVAEEVRDVRHAKRIVLSMLLGLLLVSLDGMFQLYVGHDLIRHRPVIVHLGLPRITAAFAAPNMLGVYLVLFLPLGICRALYHDKGSQKYFSLVTSTFALFCLLSTFGRGSFAGFLIALIFIGVMKKDKMIFTALILLLAIIPIVLPQSIKDWKKTKVSFWEFLIDTQEHKGDQRGSRIGDWRNALNMIRHNPLTGVGVNTYVLNFEKYKVKDGSRYESDTQYSHNIYLHMVAEIGPFGLLAFFWLLVRVFRSGLHHLQSLESDFLKVTTLGALAGLIAFLVNGLTETVLYYSKVVSLFWFCVGLVLAMPRLSKQTQGLQEVS